MISTFDFLRAAGFDGTQMNDFIGAIKQDFRAAHHRDHAMLNRWGRGAWEAGPLTDSRGRPMARVSHVIPKHIYFEWMNADAGQGESEPFDPDRLKWAEKLFPEMKVKEQPGQRLVTGYTGAKRKVVARY